MKNAFVRLFWGFLFVLFEIFLFVFDVLPEPIGYWLIYSGIAMLSSTASPGKKAKNLSFILIFISIPTVFHQNAQANQIVTLTGWDMYMYVLEMLKLILIFYVFQIMLGLAKKLGEESLVIRTTRTFTVYMVVMLFILIAHAFFINLSGDLLAAFTIIFIAAGLILEITFLVLLRAFYKLDDDH